MDLLQKQILEKAQIRNAVETDLHIEDLKVGNNDDDYIISIFINENGSWLTFARPQAKALVEAMQEIISRYPETTEEI